MKKIPDYNNENKFISLPLYKKYKNNRYELYDWSDSTFNQSLKNISLSFYGSRFNEEKILNQQLIDNFFDMIKSSNKIDINVLLFVTGNMTKEFYTNFNEKGKNQKFLVENFVISNAFSMLKYINVDFIKSKKIFFKKTAKADNVSLKEGNNNIFQNSEYIFFDSSNNLQKIILKDSYDNPKCKGITIKDFPNLNLENFLQNCHKLSNLQFIIIGREDPEKTKKELKAIENLNKKRLKPLVLKIVKPDDISISFTKNQSHKIARHIEKHSHSEESILNASSSSNSSASASHMLTNASNLFNDDDDLMLFSNAVSVVEEDDVNEFMNLFPPDLFSDPISNPFPTSKSTMPVSSHLEDQQTFYDSLTSKDLEETLNTLMDNRDKESYQEDHINNKKKQKGKGIKKNKNWEKKYYKLKEENKNLKSFINSLTNSQNLSQINTHPVYITMNQQANNTLLNIPFDSMSQTFLQLPALANNSSINTSTLCDISHNLNSLDHSSTFSSSSNIFDQNSPAHENNLYNNNFSGNLDNLNHETNNITNNKAQESIVTGGNDWDNNPNEIESGEVKFLKFREFLKKILGE
jgi:hypothetical protein